MEHNLVWRVADTDIGEVVDVEVYEGLVWVSRARVLRELSFVFLPRWMGSETKPGPWRMASDSTSGNRKAKPFRLGFILNTHVTTL
jgi:hypothetical protein